MASSELSTVAATLLDDQEYLRELSAMCSDKATTWDQRTKVRQDELAALTAALEIIKATVSEKTTAATMRLVQQGASLQVAEANALNPKAMEQIEAEAEAAEDAGPVSFLQRVSVQPVSFLGKSPSIIAKTSKPSDGARQRIAEIFKHRGQQLKSVLLTSLANQIAEDHFAKVKTLIQELIERLLQEAAHDSNQKDWCDKSISDAEQKRDYAEEAVEKHNAAMAVLEANRDKLNEELSVLSTEIGDLGASRLKAEQLRAQDKAANENTVNETQEGLSALKQ